MDMNNNKKINKVGKKSKNDKTTMDYYMRLTTFYS